MKEGEQQLSQKDFVAAAHSFRQAHEIVNLPTTGLALARALERAGLLVEALEAADNAAGLTGDKPVHAAAQEQAKELFAALQKRVPQLAVSVSSTSRDEKVFLDDKALVFDAGHAAMQVNPGVHKISGEVGGKAIETVTVTLAEGEQRSITLKSEGVNEAATPGESTAGVSSLVWVGYGVGVLGLGFGATTGILSLSKASAAEDFCDGTACSAEAQDDIDASKSLALMSNIGFGVGAAGAVLGTVALLFWSGDDEPAVNASSGAWIMPLVGPTGAGVVGQF